MTTGDPEREGEGMRVGGRAQATDEKHADPDEGDAGNLSDRRGVPERND